MSSQPSASSAGESPGDDALRHGWSGAGHGVQHYENFPVASWLCPAAIRPAVQAIYWFARTADDLADEGNATPEQRLEALQDYTWALENVLDGKGAPALSAWPHVFTPLAWAVQSHQLPAAPLRDLLSAFKQDVAYTRDERSYQTEAELDDYCSRSASPVGRLILHLTGVHDTASFAQSDHICTALQRINFWQDLSLDIPRGRHYLSDEACARHGVTRAELADGQTTPRIAQLLAEQVRDAERRMHAGAALVHRVPGRMGWELRLVVQGGLRIAQRIRQLGHTSLEQRSTLRRRDAAAMLWLALRM